MATSDTNNSKSKSRRSSHEEDVALVSCMVYLHNLGTKNADSMTLDSKVDICMSWRGC